MSPKAKRILEIVKNVLVWIVIITAILMTVFTVFTVAFVDKEDRTFFGMRMMIVLSGSMRQYFPEGDLIFTVDVDPQDLKKGDIITFSDPSLDEHAKNKRMVYITHKIKTVNRDEETGKIKSFKTFGTTTGAEDDFEVTPGEVVGEYVFRLPKLGYFFQFMKTTPGYICCILIPFLLIIGYQGFNCVMLFRKYRSEQVSEMRLEREKLEEERAESQRMMQELLALKAQLEQNQANNSSPPASEKDEE